MIVIPSIDLRRGQCVRPARSGVNDDVIPLGNPIMVARSWANAGFRHIHVGDTDAASGSGSNADLVEDIIRDGTGDVNAGGGIQSGDDISRLVDAGVTRVVVGDRGLDEPAWLASVSAQFPGVVVVASDVRERRVVRRGWVRTLPLDIFDVLGELRGLALGGLLLSAIGNDGHSASVDLALIEDVADRCDFPVLMSGSVATMDDLRALEHRGVAAALPGATLYSGELDVRSVAQEFGG